MKVVAYCCDDPAQTLMPLAEQEAAIGHWLEAADWELCGWVVGGGTQGLGEALACCRKSDATLLVANTVRLRSQNDVALFTIPVVDTVVVYYREDLSAPEESAAALADQKRRVAAWLKATGATILDSVTEQEGILRGKSPALGKAVARCISTDATLLIARTAPIKGYASFHPSTGPVRYETIPGPLAPAPPQPVDVPARMPVPDGAPTPFCLYFIDRGFPFHADGVYFCNNTSDALWGDPMSGLRSASVDEDQLLMVEGNGSDDIGMISPHTAVLVDHFHRIYDADFLNAIALTMQSMVTEERFTLRGVFGKGVPAGSWVALDQDRDVR